MSKEIVKSKTAIQEIASRLHVSPDILEKTLKATIIKGKDRPATNEEFVSFIVVANQYNLNPLTKEIYAFPDKQGGIIPIVATDGWNNLMTSHKNYKAHYYKESDKRVTMTNAKPCPEWMEIHIVKKDDSEVVVREYLDECFNGNKKNRSGAYYASPWDTHTKRMLRHKTKIQGAREAFGFGGIFDEDEGERIIDMGHAEVTAGKPQVTETLSKKELEAQNNAEPTQEESQPVISEEERAIKFQGLLKKFDEAQKALGDKAFFEILIANDVSASDKIPSFERGEEILEQLHQKIADDFDNPKPKVEEPAKKAKK